MIVKATSKLSTIAKLDPLDDVEQEEGILAFSAMFYQYGAKLSAELLLISWIIAVIVPRVITYFERIEAERKAKLLEFGTPPPTPTPPTQRAA